MLPRTRKKAAALPFTISRTCVQQAAARENKDNKEVRERAERARAARAEREGAAATAQAYKSALGLAAKHDWGAKPKAPAAGGDAVLAITSCPYAMLDTANLCSVWPPSLAGAPG